MTVASRLDGTRTDAAPQTVLCRLRLPAGGAVDAAVAARLGAGLLALQQRVDAPNVFHDLDVMRAATGLVGPIDVHWLERDGAVLAALPVFRRRVGFGAAGSLPYVLAHGFGPAGTPLVDPDVALGDLAALIAAARDDAPALVLPYVEADSAAVEAVVAAAGLVQAPVTWLATHSRAGLSFAGIGRGDPVAAISTKRRKEWGRLERRLADHGPIAHQRDTAPDAVAAAFDDVVALEARGWKGRRATALAFDAPGRAFGAAAVAALAARGLVIIDRLMLDGRSVAGLVSFRIAGRLWIWKTAYDEDFARYSPGVQLMLRVTRRIADDGTIVSADSLATPDHPMIDAIWPERLVMTTLVVAKPGSGVGRRLALEVALYERLRGLVRWLLRR